MSQITRRNFLKLSGAAAAASSLSLGSVPAFAKGMKKVVVIGGGTGGATAAKYLRVMDKDIEVTLIEPNKHYYTCYMSNEVLSGERSLDSLKHGYDGLRGHGVKVVHAKATGIDAGKRVVTTDDGQKFSYDRCIVSPGVSFKYDAVDGYSHDAAQHVTHAWKAGPQTATLRKQLENMKNGGTFIIVAPPNPFRCPPGPYERASQVAHYFKQHKPKSKILILDPKPKFSKMGLFTAGWKQHYGYETGNSLIEWRGTPKGSDDNVVNSISNIKADGSASVETGFESYQGDVVNLIPPQVAGHIAATAGLTDGSGWCPVDMKTFESTLHANIHVIGDAAIQSPLPKSGYAANSEAKACAAAVVALLNDMKAPKPTFVNTCYSIIAPGDGISVAAVYRYDDATGKVSGVKGAGGLSPGGYDKDRLVMREREEEYAYSWYNNLTADAFK